MDEQQQLNLITAKNMIREIDDEIQVLRNNRYNINKEYIELLKEKCRENIGRCFKKLVKDKVVSYCKIIDIDNPKRDFNNELFNEYQYPALWFIYPYNNSTTPFTKENLFSGAWGKGNNCTDDLNGISYIEITKEEYDEKFNEVNLAWIDKVKNI